MAEFNKEWLRAAGIRAIKTVAQTAVRCRNAGCELDDGLVRFDPGGDPVHADKCGGYS